MAERIYNFIVKLLCCILMFFLTYVFIDNFEHRNMIRRGCPNMIQPIENKVPLSLKWNHGKEAAYTLFISQVFGNATPQNLLIPDENARDSFWDDLGVYVLQLYLYPISVSDSDAYDWQISENIFNVLEGQVKSMNKFDNMTFCAVDQYKDVQRWAMYIYQQNDEYFVFTLPSDFKKRISDVVE